MKIALIGAGVSGLSLAARLAKNGFEVDVYDLSSKVGGKMYQYTNEENISWDTGPTLISMPDEIINTFKELNYPCPELIPLNENCHLSFSDGSHWKIPLGKEKILSFFKELNIKDSEQLNHVFEIAKSIYDFAEKNLFHTEPPSFLTMGFKSFKSGFIFKNSKIALKPYSEVVDDLVVNKNLREFLYHFTSYVGLLPSVAQGGILSLAHVELGSEIVFPKGGVYSIASALYGACLFYKVKFFLNSKVTAASNMKHNNKDIWRIKYETQGIINENSYDILVSNSDPFVASLSWLKDSSFSNPFYSKLKENHYTASESQFVILFDWADPSNISHHIKIFPKSFRSSFEEVYINKKIPEDPCVYLVWPHATDKSISPRVLFISAMAPNTQAEYIWDESFSNRYAKKIINICQNRLQLPFQGKVFKTISPLELELRTQSLNGGIYSAAPTKFNPMHFQFSGLSQLKNLYFVGAGVHPGAGVPMVMKSARRIAEVIMKKHQFYAKGNS